MEKRINSILVLLKITLSCVWLGAAAFLIMGELGVYANVAVDQNGQEAFVLNCVAICLTIIGVPLTLKFFKLCTIHSLRRMNNDEALDRYVLHSVIRNIVMMIIACMDVSVYYITANDLSGALCALIVVVISLFCYPNRKQLDEYLEKVNSDID